MKSCNWFKGHNWSKWKDIKEGALLRRGTSFVEGFYIVQEKECQTCGKKKRRNVETY